jgi:hypothetical protein
LGEDEQAIYVTCATTGSPPSGTLVPVIKKVKKDKPQVVPVPVIPMPGLMKNSDPPG